MKRDKTENAISPKCEYCAYGRLAPDGETVLCPKKGVVSREDKCRRFQYDILKRKPRKAPALSSYSAEDFEL